MEINKPKTYTVKAGKPAPFQRPGIDLDKHGRDWDTVEANSLKEGDVVKNKGLVQTIFPFVDPDYDIEEVQVVFASGEVRTYRFEAEVEAFVKKVEQ